MLILLPLWLAAAPSQAQPVCAGCHAAIADSYARTAMARSFRKITSQTELPEFDGRTFDHSASAQRFTPYRKDGAYWLRRDEDGRNVIEKQAHYVFGSGNHARSYLHRTAGGRLIELPLTWYQQGGWAMSPAFDRPDHPGFTRQIEAPCMFCHNAYPKDANLAAELPEGIDCRRCHGDGSAHAAAPVKGSIVNPAKLAAPRQLEICMQCHLETTSLRLPAATLRTGREVFSFRPGEPLENYMLHFTREGGEQAFDFVSAVTRLRQSKCFQASAGRMTCTTCHDPHRPPAETDFDKSCRRCHATLAASHAPANNCASCHMPKRRASDVVHARATDHRIEAHPPAEPATMPIERHDGNTPPYRGEVKLYYPERLPASAENEIALAIAQVKHQSNLAAGIDRLRTALSKHPPRHSEPWFELGEALREAGRFKDALAPYERALALPPARWQHPHGYGLALVAAGQVSRAIDAFRRASALAPAEPQPYFALGDALAQQNQFVPALDAFQQSIALDPDQAVVQNNLGTTLLKLGRKQPAEAAFREAVRLRPDLSAARLNLANLLLASGRFTEAAHQARAAARTDTALGVPGQYRARLTLGLALLQSGRTGEAQSELRAAAESKEEQVRELARQALAASGSR